MIEIGQCERVDSAAQSHTRLMPFLGHRSRLLVAFRVSGIEGIELVKENIGKDVIPK